MQKKHKKDCNKTTHFKPFVKKGSPLKVVRWDAAGIDLGSKSHFVALTNPENKDEVFIREFSVFTSGLKECIDWLKECGVGIVAMESTGVYWLHFYCMLADAGFEVVLANARHVKNVKGKKTDVQDAEWLMQLISYGMLEGSFVPTGADAKLRGYFRSRGLTVKTLSFINQRIQKCLISMNFRLDTVVNDITGKTGMLIIKAIINGERDPNVLAENRDPRCRKSKQEIAEALHGCFREDQLHILKKSVREYEFYMGLLREDEHQIESLLQSFPKEESSSEVDESKKGNEIKARKKRNSKFSRIHEFSFDVRSYFIQILGVDLMQLPGISETTLLAFISEVGTDISKWKTAKHFCAWLKLAPNNQVTGGKVLRNAGYSKPPNAARALRMAVVSLYREAVPTALGEYYRRMRARKGPRAAITATAHKLARMLYYVLKTGKPFIEPGADEYSKMQLQRRIANARAWLNVQGYEVRKKAPLKA